MNKKHFNTPVKRTIINYLVPSFFLFYEQFRSLGINLPFRVFRKKPNIKDVTRIRNVRVILNKGIKEVDLSFIGPYEIYDESTNQFLASGDNGSITISTSYLRGLSIKGHRSRSRFTSTTVRFVSKTPIYIRDLGYRGNILITCTGDSLQLINILGVEEYLKGVVPAEMATDAPREALKAQAVASRSYVSFQILMERQLYDVDATVMNQLYKGISVETTASSEAVQETLGEILAYGYQPANTLFHFSCGGITEDIKDVWGRPLPYLISVECPCDSKGSLNHWYLEIKKEEFVDIFKNLNVQGIQIFDIQIVSQTPSCRVNSLRIVTERGAYDVNVDSLRHMIGVDRLRSGRFSLTETKDSLVFEGIGWGHGVGMCQIGAIELAERGYTYKEILKRYYTGTHVCKVKNLSEC